MKKQILKLASITLALLMLIPMALASCSKTDNELEIDIYSLNGTTAIGMAQMIDSAKNDTDNMNYDISIFAEADKVTSAIISGECDIAALPTNVAAKLYKKSEGKIQLLALNTLGVLYLVDSTGTIKSFDDLKGKTVYVPGGGANPEYITASLLTASGLNVGTDVTLDTTTYAAPKTLSEAIIAGKADIAVIPEPMVSQVTTKKSDVTVAIDLTEEWEKLYGENTLVQGCLVVNKSFADEHPNEVKQFLEDYKASVEFISKGSDEAINMIVDAEIIGAPAIAKKALPNCNICCITGKDMKNSISVFYEKLYAYSPASIAAIPDDGFYYTAK